MGYRADETALAARRDYVASEVAELEAELEGLTRRGDALAQELRRKRWKLRLRIALRWLRNHPKLVFLILLITGIVTYAQIKSYQARKARERHVARVLGQGCKTRLKVMAQPPAKLWIDDLMVGKTPRTVPICPGSYMMQLTHGEMLPWRRRVVVTQSSRQNLSANLVPWDPNLRPKDGLVVHSRPDGALAFVEGAEAGRTPLLLRASAFPRRQVTIGVAAPGRRPFVKKVVLHKRDIWVHLPSLPAEGAR
mgnify:CR=1 FL=1